MNAMNVLILVILVVGIVLILGAAAFYEEQDNSDSRALAMLAFFPGIVVLVVDLVIWIGTQLYRNL